MSQQYFYLHRFQTSDQKRLVGLILRFAFLLYLDTYGHRCANKWEKKSSWIWQAGIPCKTSFWPQMVKLASTVWLKHVWMLELSFWWHPSSRLVLSLFMRSVSKRNCDVKATVFFCWTHWNAVGWCHRHWATAWKCLVLSCETRPIFSIPNSCIICFYEEPSRESVKQASDLRYVRGGEDRIPNRSSCNW